MLKASSRGAEGVHLIPLQTVSIVTVKVRFMPDGVNTTAKAGEPLLTVAARAGVHISTGCLAGACHACEVEITGEEEPTLACLRAIPKGVEAIEITMFDDPTW